MEKINEIEELNLKLENHKNLKIKTLFILLLIISKWKKIQENILLLSKFQIQRKIIFNKLGLINHTNHKILVWKTDGIYLVINKIMNGFKIDVRIYYIIYIL